MELKAWKSVKYCPKCGANRFHRPLLPGAGVEYSKDDVGCGSHMVITCRICSYAWKEECKDG